MRPGHNAYGKTPEQRAEIARYLDTVEPILRRAATLELDGRRRASELADVIEELVTQTPDPAHSADPRGPRQRE
jgi:hypothetical protein